MLKVGQLQSPRPAEGQTVTAMGAVLRAGSPVHGVKRLARSWEGGRRHGQSDAVGCPEGSTRCGCRIRSVGVEKTLKTIKPNR